MALTPGTRLGPYQVLSAIGAGGMGEVYRARDTRLDRTVAVKILPASFSSDPDRLMRFEREARTLASLNHAHIAQIYGIEESSGTRALVMEFVEGEDLAQRIERGGLPMDVALAIAKQVAGALEAAHEAGIVHRDLKPANIRIRGDGTVKILDFGLAKAPPPAPESPDTEGPRSDAPGDFPKGVAQPSRPAESPTFTSPAFTGIGVILGTVAYMAPEQAKGQPVDKRADIWAFGCVLFEMLAGQRPFAAPTMTETMAAVVLNEPNWSLLPASTPIRIRELLHRCLEKDPRRRLRDIGDAAYELTAADVAAAAPAPARRLSWTYGAALVLAGAALAAIGVITFLRPSAESPGARRFTIAGLSPLTFDANQSLTLAPDGSALAFRGRGTDGIERIYVRPLDALEVRPVTGSEGGRMPFFSSDSAWLGFFAGGALKKIALAGGPAQTLAAAPNPSGGTWMDDGTIVFVGDHDSGLQRVSADGGTPTTIYRGDEAARNVIATPWGLPGSTGVLLMIRDGARYDLASLSLATGELRVFAEDAYSPAWAATGHALFHRGDAIFAIPYDLGTLSPRGSAFPVMQGIGTRISYQSRLFAVDNGGTLVYAPAADPGDAGWGMVRIDRDGKETLVARLDRQADTPRFSPDGTRVAFRTPAPNCDIWVRDLARGTSVRLTAEGDNHGVVWHPDGTRVISSRPVAAGTDILAFSADGTGAPEVLAHLTEMPAALATSTTPGMLFVQDRYTARNGTDIVGVPVSGGKWQPLLAGPADESSATLSPDGTLLAYVSDESGRNEIYVRPHPGPGPRTMVSTGGGIEPAWSPSGEELFFRSGRDLLVARFDPGSGGGPATPRVLFSGDYPVGPQVTNYAVYPDGRGFLMMRGRQWADQQLVAVVNWLSEIHERSR